MRLHWQGDGRQSGTSARPFDPQSRRRKRGPAGAAARSSETGDRGAHRSYQTARTANMLVPEASFGPHAPRTGKKKKQGGYQLTERQNPMAGGSRRGALVDQLADGTCHQPAVLKISTRRPESSFRATAQLMGGHARRWVFRRTCEAYPRSPSFKGISPFAYEALGQGRPRSVGGPGGRRAGLHRDKALLAAAEEESSRTGNADVVMVTGNHSRLATLTLVSVRGGEKTADRVVQS